MWSVLAGAGTGILLCASWAIAYQVGKNAENDRLTGKKDRDARLSG